MSLTVEQLYSRVTKNKNGCWEFTGALRSGYGAIKYNSKVCGTHRVSYELNYGLIPNNMLVCHKCDNRKCINPDHLFLGTHKDNMQDCLSKGRMVINKGVKFIKGYYPKNTNISLEKAIFVKNLILNRGKKTLVEIAKENEIPYQYARDVSCGKILKGR